MKHKSRFQLNNFELYYQKTRAIPLKPVFKFDKISKNTALIGFKYTSIKDSISSDSLKWETT